MHRCGCYQGGGYHLYYNITYVYPFVWYYERDEIWWVKSEEDAGRYLLLQKKCHGDQDVISRLAGDLFCITYSSGSQRHRLAEILMTTDRLHVNGEILGVSSFLYVGRQRPQARKH